MENETEETCIATASTALGVVEEVLLLRNSWSGQNSRVSQAGCQEGRRGWGGSRTPPIATKKWQTPKWKGGESYGGDKRKWKRLQRSVWRGRDGSDVAWGVAITHNGPWSSRSMWTCCSRSGSRCWTSTFGPQPADPEPQRQPGDISNLPQGPSLSVPLETWSRRHAPFSD